MPAPIPQAGSSCRPTGTATVGGRIPEGGRGGASKWISAYVENEAQDVALAEGLDARPLTLKKGVDDSALKLGVAVAKRDEAARGGLVPSRATEEGLQEAGGGAHFAPRVKQPLVEVRSP